MGSICVSQASAWKKKRPYILVFSLFIAIFYYVPVLLLWFGIIPFKFRFYVLIMLAIVLAAYSYSRKHSLHELGFRIDNLKKSLFLNSIFALLILGALITFYYLGAIRQPTVPGWKWFYLFYVLISAPAQEFLFRSVLFAELRKSNFSSAFLQIVITSITYSFLHIIYNDWITLIVTLLMGIIWGAVYYKIQNFWGIAFSHAVLGAISISIGLI